MLLTSAAASLANSFAPPNATATGYALLRLDAPWLPGVGALSRAAGRAIREAPNASAVEFVASAAERRRLQEGGAAPALVHADASEFFAARAAAYAATAPEGRRLEASHPTLQGSMGGYYTGAEIQKELRRLAAAYPKAVSTAKTITKSVGGLPIELVCVTANLEGCDGLSDRPAVLYTALVHAREPATVMCLIAFLRDVLEQAGSGRADALALLQQRKLLFIANANPDGYSWNERTHPRGGGMKRKNGRHTCTRGGADDGVDPNRNFGYKYAFDNSGSSSNGCSEEFRGAGAFSEPETQAIRTVTRLHKPAAILHWHGWGNDLAFPFSYDWKAPMAANELGLFQEFASEMTATNGYASGRAWESVGYMTNGEADDWGWGDEHAVSLTLEVGASSDSFWPRPDRIATIAAETISSATYLAWASGPMLQLDSLSLADAADGRRGTLTLRLQNNGLGDVSGEHVACVSKPASGLAIVPSTQWRNRDGQLCTAVAALPARNYAALPALHLQWTGGGAPRQLEFSLSLEPVQKGGSGSAAVEAASSSSGGGGGGSGSAAPALSVAVAIQNSAQTLTQCDDLCMCKSADKTRLRYSHECRTALPPGSHCRLAKAAHAGSNWASGVVDEYFEYKATQYLRGGVCQMQSTHRDTLLAVYESCTRFGAQKPVGFANSEGASHASVSFPCVAGGTYFLFWNAEYVPGRFSFSIEERCTGGSCLRAHRMRAQLRRAKKLRRTKLL